MRERGESPDPVNVPNVASLRELRAAASNARAADAFDGFAFSLAADVLPAWRFREVTD
jgi:hypothetical protein